MADRPTKQRRASAPTPFRPLKVSFHRQSRLGKLHSLDRVLRPLGLGGFVFDVAHMVEVDSEVKKLLGERNWTSDPEPHLPEILRSVPSALRSPMVLGLLHDLRLRAGPEGETRGEQLGLTNKAREKSGKLDEDPVIGEQVSASRREANVLLRRCTRAIGAPLLDHGDPYWRTVAAEVQALIDEGKTSRFAHEKIGKGLGQSAGALRGNLTRRNLQVSTKK